MTPRLTVIIVTYNSAEVIQSALASIDASLPVIIVDNASSDATCTEAMRLCPRAQLIRSAENLGFGRANNLALAQVATEFALLLNPDAALHSGCCEQLLATADRYPNAAIIAPVLLNSDGSQQDNYKNSIFHHRNTSIQHLPEGDLCADYLSGAVLLMRMQHMTPLGFFDPAIFMFFEDDDICMRAKAAGHDVLVCALAVAVHLSGRSSPPKLRYLYRKNWHMSWSRLYIERKYHGTSAAVRLALLQCSTYALKTLGYALLLNAPKTIKSLARFSAAVTFLCYP
jgi:N-acetylglucosaminyl-diphospho-decaprenol L-rhamnosyltransferase